MDWEAFIAVTEDQWQRCLAILRHRHEKYGTSQEVFELVRAAARLLDCEPEQAVLFFLTKHLVTLTKYIQEMPDRIRPQPDWQETMADIHNYLFLLAGLLEERFGRQPCTCLGRGRRP